MTVEIELKLENGIVFDDRYMILECLGEGGMGTVYKAREINIDRIIALKILKTALLGDLEDRARFKTEGRILAQLQHQNVVGFFRYGIFADKFPYIEMELLEGQSLRSLMNASGLLAHDEVVSLALQICDALNAVSQVGIVHRDLKPTNIVLIGDAQKQVKLIDFGISRVLASSPVAVTQHLTKTGLLIGSIHYMSPNSAWGKRQIRVLTFMHSDVCYMNCFPDSNPSLRTVQLDCCIRH